MIELKEKRIFLSVFILIVVLFTLNFSLSILRILPSETNIKNSKDSINITDLEVKLKTTGWFMVSSNPLSPPKNSLWVDGSIYDPNNLSLNYLFEYTDILNLWVIINSILYKASEIRPSNDPDSLFSAKIYHENLYHDIGEISILDEQIGLNAAMIEIIIQLSEIGQGQFLKTETVIYTNA